MKKLLSAVIFFLLVLNSCTNRVAGVFDITDYGAVADTSVLSTSAIQKAIDCCTAAGGGKVVIPSGAFKTGTIILKDNVTLEVLKGATLYGSTNFSDYPFIEYDIVARCTQKPNYQLIFAQNATDVSICGEGTIDGRGGMFPKIKGSQGGHIRPLLIRFIKCRNVKISGLHLRNAPRWMQHYLWCDNLVIDGIDIFNRSNYNNDGIDVDGCHDVRISNVLCDSDDDGIVFKSTTDRLCENVVVSNCVVSSHCNAIKFGTETNGGFRNFSISNCVIKPSECDDALWWGRIGGLAGLNLAIADGGIMENIRISGITIDGTQSPIYVRLCNRGTPYSDDIPVKGVGKLRNISISDVRAMNAGLTGSSISGIPGYPVENISLNNIFIETQGGVDPSKIVRNPEELEKSYPECTKFGILPARGLFFRHVRGLSLGNVQIQSVDSDPRPDIVEVDVVKSFDSVHE